MKGRRIEAVADSSTYVALDIAGILEKTVLLFNPIHLPIQVRRELRRRRGRRDRLHQLRGVVRNCHQYDAVAGRLLLGKGRDAGQRDLGEVEAIQQAVALGATLLVDDSWGRSIAQKMGLTCIGSIGVLERLHELRLLNLDDVRSAVVRMMDGGIRLPIEYLKSKGWLEEPETR